MPKKGYKQTKEHREKISESQKGEKNFWFGKHCSEETKEKISKANKGKKRSEETKKKMREAQKGEMNFWFGKHHSKEHKEKVSKALLGRISGMKGKHHSEEAREKIGLGNKGKIVSEEAKEKMSKSKKGKKQWWHSSTEFKKGNKGNKCFAWKGGKSDESQLVRGSIELKNWRKAVFVKDNWTCQKTGIRGKTLNAHHIKNFSEFPTLRFDITNGTSLLKEVHEEFHKKYGKMNNTKEQLREFLMENN